METANTSPQPNSCERFKVAIVAPSFKFVGGHAVQAELLLRLWNGDPAVETIFVPIDPPLPKWSNWAKQIRGLRTLLREPLYMLLLWRALGNMNIAHIFRTTASQRARCRVSSTMRLRAEGHHHRLPGQGGTPP